MRGGGGRLQATQSHRFQGDATGANYGSPPGKTDRRTRDHPLDVVRSQGCWHGGCEYALSAGRLHLYSPPGHLPIAQNDGKNGLLVRNGTDADGRFTQVCLTAEGRRKMDLCYVLVKDLNEHFTNKLQPQAFDELMQMIDTLTEGENVTLMRL